MNTNDLLIFCWQLVRVAIGVSWVRAKRVLVNPLYQLCLKCPGRRWVVWFIGTYTICMQRNLPTGPQWIWGYGGPACAEWHWNSQETRGRFPVPFTVLWDPYVCLMHLFYSGQSSNLISAGPLQLPTLNLWLRMGSRESACALQCPSQRWAAKQQPTLPNGAWDVQQKWDFFGFFYSIFQDTHTKPEVASVQMVKRSDWPTTRWMKRLSQFPMRNVVKKVQAKSWNCKWSATCCQ